MNDPLINQAIEYCIQHNHRLTKPRLEVLKAIAASNKPIGAYQVLNELKDTLNCPKPPTVYRAIEFWQACHFIHRIESLNAYVTCQEDHLHHGSQFMICDDCGAAFETHMCEIPDNLKEQARKNKFVPSQWNLEIHGLCSECL